MPSTPSRSAPRLSRATLPLEPPTLRVNPRRVAAAPLLAGLEAQGFRFEAIPGLPSLHRVVHEPFPISRTLEHWLGMFYLQQAATGVAALALGAEPGERVLDLCAAPGGKASHIAERLGETGLLVAGENNPGRVRALLGNLYRLGHGGVLTVSSDGRVFPGGARFDRVLLDVPCSGEGNARRRRGGRSASPASADFRAHIVGVQRALLRRAADLVRPGGTVLYVTCTTAAEENEAVIARALARLPFSIQPISLDLPHTPGWTRHDGKSYPAELELAWRLEPGHLGSGRLFMARLRREPGEVDGLAPEEPAGAGWSPVPTSYPDDDGSDRAKRLIEETLGMLQGEWGVEAGTLAGARWMVRGDSVWLHTATEWPLDAWGPDASARAGAGWRFVSLGVRAFQEESSGRHRPTNDLLRRLDGGVRARAVELSRAEARRFLERGDTPAPGLSDGYAALRVEGHGVGRGFVRSGRVRSEIPRAQAKLLLEALGDG